MSRTIYFDMDGTLAALFFIKGFAERLESGDCSVYTECRTLYKVNEMSATIAALKTKGYDIGIISYADESNLEKARAAKMEWLSRHFPYANSEKIHIVTKAVSKASYYHNGDVLVDDARANREEWESKGGQTINAYFRAKIPMMEALKAL